MTSYDITITREGKWWMVKIPALDGLTQARRLADAEQMAKEYIAVTLDVPLSTVTLGHVAISVPGTADVESSLAEITALRTQAEEAEATAAKLVRTLASDMATAGVPVRDIGQMLGVSFQRASQLVNA
ncbi:MAG: type II toxin-antitoxin system HicB family antitoxin [Nocardioidaceae bacterium]|nr:MAG: type II toxin-antitoxin system HicB family antitoxin [Nocardioidaceae bacterium]